MIKLGFVSAILADQTFEQVISFAAETEYSCVEIMCWPVGKAERRYAGVTHIDVGGLSKKKIDEIHSLLEQNRVTISGLGYYPNPLEADKKNASRYVAHLKKVIDAANRLGLKTCPPIRLWPAASGVPPRKRFDTGGSKRERP